MKGSNFVWYPLLSIAVQIQIKYIQIALKTNKPSNNLKPLKNDVSYLENI
jgi:hypothetical protein